MKEKARHILCLAFLKSGEKNMEKILIYQVKEKEAVKQLLAPMKIRLEEIKTTDLRQSIGDLAEGKKNVLTAPFTGSAPQESLMVFCGVNEKHFDKILFELRRKQIPVDYKAVLTPSNRKWSVLMLMLEKQLPAGKLKRNRDRSETEMDKRADSCMKCKNMVT